MKINIKLTLAFLAFLLLLVAVAYAGLAATNFISGTYAKVEMETIPVIESLGEVKSSGTRIVTSTHEFVSLMSENRTDSALLQNEYGKIISGIELYNRSLSRYEDLVNRYFPEKKPFLEEAINSGIINLSALARQILPEVRRETFKEVQEGAILMALKRLPKTLKPKPGVENVLENSHDLI
ncbi:MAG: hypothetical protein KJ729_06445, partial [Euryarchaeota archaeon]|nr:hypothetical protein [Euryarchaeota archaeon]